MIESEWEDMRHIKSHHDVFIFSNYLKTNLDETCLILSNVVLRIVGYYERSHNDKNTADRHFYIIFLNLGSDRGDNGTVLLLDQGNLVHPRLRKVIYLLVWLYRRIICYY